MLLVFEDGHDVYLISNFGLGAPARSVKVTKPAKYTGQTSSHAANQSSSTPTAPSVPSWHVTRKLLREVADKSFKRHGVIVHL